MIKINIHEAKTHLSHYIEEVESGETIILCRRNKPVAELRPLDIHRHKPRSVGLAKGKFKVPASFFENLPEETLALYQTAPKSPFPETTLDEVASCLPYFGKGKSLPEMDAAIKKGARKRKPKA